MSPASKRAGPAAFVVGVGNILWADEGFGVRCAEAFAEKYDAGLDVDIVDGGTQGLALVNELADARRVLIFDAVDFDADPGSLIVATGEDVPRFVAGKKVSLHQTSMMEVLALAEVLAGGPPEEIALVGCQPAELEDYGGGLTPQAAAQVAPAIGAAAAQLAAWGLPVSPRRDAGAPLMPAEVARGSYEDGRPSAQAACRRGDARVLARSGAPGER
ncbi:MAG: HyaD/HybD family hydrogenase maturation endopeptidase [Pseudomonadota bacterium]